MIILFDNFYIKQLNGLFVQNSFPCPHNFCFFIGAVHNSRRLYTSDAAIDDKVNLIAELFFYQSGVVMYSISSPSSKGKVVVSIGASSNRQISRMMLLSGIRMPTSLRFLNILGKRLPVFNIKVNGPGRFLFINLKVELFTLAYSLILLKS